MAEELGLPPPPGVPGEEEPIAEAPMEVDAAVRTASEEDLHVRLTNPALCHWLKVRQCLVGRPLFQTPTWVTSCPRFPHV
jgi:hypothetical protein